MGGLSSKPAPGKVPREYLEVERQVDSKPEECLSKGVSRGEIVDAVMGTNRGYNEQSDCIEDYDQDPLRYMR